MSDGDKKFTEQYVKNADDFLANPSSYTNEEVWAILRSTNANSELNCRVISTAKKELTKRGFRIY